MIEVKLFPFSWQIVGWVITGLVVLGAGLLFWQGEGLSPRFTYALQFLLALGLWLIIFSKEKVEDERTRELRLKAAFYSLFIVLGTVLAFSFVAVLSGDNDPGSPFLLVFTPAVVHVISFRLGLRGIIFKNES